MKIRIAVSALLLCGTVSLAFAAASPESFSGSYLAGRTASRLRDSEAATTFLSAALKQDPSNPILIERLFQLELSNGDIAQAEIAAEKVVSFNSQHRMSRIVLGLKDFRNRRYSQARENFTEAAYTPVGELTSTLLIAWSYAGEGALNAALKELDKLDAQESFANFKSFHAALIADYLKADLRSEAAYKKAYEMAGTSLRVVQAYGNFLERNNRAGEAEKIYQAFLGAVKQNVLVETALANAISKKKPEAFIVTPGAGAGEALFSLAAAMNDEQSIDVAQIYAQLALSFNADQPVTQSLLGDIYSDMKSYQAAVNAFELVPQTSPLRIYADTQIAINLQRLDKSQDAIAKLNSVIKREPANTDALISLGNVYRVTDDFDNAISTYTKALEFLPTAEANNWQLYYNRGIAFDRKKLWDKSEADFRRALEISKDEPSVLNYLGYSLIDRGVKLEEAIGLVKRAVDLRPNDGYIVDSLGWAYFNLRDFDQAVSYLERAVDLNPADPTIADHLGDAYWHAGRKTEAFFQWQHAKDNQPEPADLPKILAKLKNGIESTKSAVTP